MAVLDFREIPEAHIASGKQDIFEQLAAETLLAMGYEIVEGQGRGSDQGKDLIISEKRKGIGRETEVRWLVSCKHKAHSGKSIGVDDEVNLSDRIRAHNCGGFLGFYSTVPSSGLQDRLRALSPEFESQILDSAVIERHLLSSELGLQVARRYFPLSIQSWMKENPEPVKMFEETDALLCENCGRNLLDPPQGNYVLWRTSSSDGQERKIVDVHWSCKGRCDEAVSAEVKSRHPYRILDLWEDIPDVCMPLVYLKYLISRLNTIRGGEEWSDTAFDKYQTLMIAIFPFVARDVSATEADRLSRLRSMPSYMGGLGF